VHPVIYLNKTMVDADKARVAPVSSAMLYGRGVFTTLSIHNGEAFCWPAHWERLHEGAERLSINLSGLTERGVGEAIHKLATVNGVEHGRARVVLLARSGPDYWRPIKTAGAKTDLLIMTADSQKVRPTGLSLAVSPYRINTLSPLAGIRTLNCLDHVLAWEEAQKREFDDAVMLNERGEIVCTTMANIFWVKDGVVQTPTLSCGTYPGVTRANVIELARKLFIPIVEGVYELGDLTEAEEIFLTSSSLGVGLVTTFDFRQYSITPESVARKLKAAFETL
jgi:branched-subunit amino acid aminotransferase/4-amino-4-deoxychorismate lyase